MREPRGEDHPPALRLNVDTDLLYDRVLSRSRCGSSGDVREMVRFFDAESSQVAVGPAKDLVVLREIMRFDRLHELARQDVTWSKEAVPW